MKKLILSIAFILLAFVMAANAQTYNSQTYSYGNTAVDYYHYPTVGGVITQPSYYTTSYYTPYQYNAQYSSGYTYSSYPYSTGYTSTYAYGGSYQYPNQQYGYTNIRYCEDPGGREGETKILGINPKGQYICSNGRWMFAGYVTDNQPMYYNNNYEYSNKLAFYDGVLEPPYNYQYNQPIQSQPLVYARANPTVEVTYYESNSQRGNCIDPYGLEGEHKIIGLTRNEYVCQKGVWILVRDNSQANVAYDYYTYSSRPTQYFVEIKSNGFNPGFLQIRAGDTVTFVNKDSKTHWPASDPHPTHTGYPESGGCIGSMFDACHELVENATFSFTFTKIGTWGYHDHLDPFQTGTIKVDK